MIKAIIRCFGWLMPWGVVAMLTACSAQQAANFVSGAQTVCKDEASGTVIVAAADPSLLAHNASTAQKISNSCAAINATPSAAFAPVLSTPAGPVGSPLPVLPPAAPAA